MIVHKTFYVANRVPALMPLDNSCVDLERAPSMNVVTRPQCLVTLTDPESVGAKKFQALAIRLQNFQKRQRIKKLLITSSIMGEGKSVISANLAFALSQVQRTLIIDCDLHRSGLRDVLGAHYQSGLGEWWRESKDAITFLRRADKFSLWYLAAGACTESAFEILQSRRFIEMVAQIARSFDWVILDSPPLVPVADSGLLAAQADATLLVVRRGTTPKPLLREALKTENLKLLGIVANDWQGPEHRYYSQYYKPSSPNREIPAAENRRLPVAKELERWNGDLES
jgi:protein-tyrosine kinase